MIEIDVVGASRSGFEPYGLADDKGDGLGLCLPDYFRASGKGRGPALNRSARVSPSRYSMTMKSVPS
jgi:hypothetical protein